MRVFQVSPSGTQESGDLPHTAPPTGYVWISCSRQEFDIRLGEIQGVLQALCGMQLVDLHISDLLNRQLQSRYDYTAQYDLLVFRRLAAGQKTDESPSELASPATAGLHKRSGPPILRHINTSPVGFALFDKVLLTVHPVDCAVRDAYAARLIAAAADQSRGAGGRMPTSPPDLMLRIVNQMVDGYLELRRELTRQLDHWQAELLAPNTRFNNWVSLLEARLSLNGLDEVCEDQRTALQDWIAALESWPEANTPALQREHDLLKVRSRDVLEHIERVVRHVQRLEQSTETTVQMHFNAQGNRTNEIMRTLTALTAVFLPLNLITGFFGMNFEYLPLIHRQAGLWWAIATMAIVGVAFVVVFWRKRYLARTAR